MTAPQRLLSSRIRGFVCKSCLSRLQASRQPRLPVAARGFASTPQSRKGIWDTPLGTVRYFDQDENGVRTEITEEDDELVDTLRTKLQKIEETTGKTMDDLDEDDLQNLLKEISAESKGATDPDGFLEGGLPDTKDDTEAEQALDVMTKQHTEVQSRLDFINSFDLENLSDDDRDTLRAGLLGSPNEGML